MPLTTSVSIAGHLIVITTYWLWCWWLLYWLWLRRRAHCQRRSSHPPNEELRRLCGAGCGVGVGAGCGVDGHGGADTDCRSGTGCGVGGCCTGCGCVGVLTVSGGRAIRPTRS